MPVWVFEIVGCLPISAAYSAASLVLVLRKVTGEVREISQWFAWQRISLMALVLPLGNTSYR
jgi:hypothetical protein